MIEVQPAYSETAYRISLFGDEIESISHFDPMTGEVFGHQDELIIYPATHYVTSPPTIERAVEEIRRELDERVDRLRQRRQAARGPPAAPAHRVRPGDDARGRLLQRHRELLADPRRPRAGLAAVHAARLLPGRLPGDHRRVAPDGAPDRRHVRGRPLPQDGAGRARLPAAVGARQPAAALRRVHRPGAAGDLRLGHAGRRSSCATRATWWSRSSARPASSTPRSRCGRRGDQIDDLLGRDPPARAGRRARAGHDADQEDGRGPDRLPARVGRPGALPALRDRHAASGSRSSATCASASSTCSSA